MADKAISELVAASEVTGTDLFVLEQAGTAKRLSGQTLTTFLLKTVEAHGGIVSIEKTSTSGLKDIYTITMADLSTTTFTVTNGAKGDKGDNAYIWIKYSSNLPTQDSDIYDTPDNYIGVYCGAESTAPTTYQSYEWFCIKGEQGTTGDPAKLTSQSVQYQASTSGTIIPSGTWLDSIPAVSQGQYLWTRSILKFNTGDPLYFYSVTRFGIDGAGSVKTVNGISPDSEGNVTLVTTGENYDKGRKYSINNNIEKGAARITTLNEAALSLDAEALYGKSYRDIFQTANIVQGGDFEGGFSEDWTLYNAPLISGEAYTSPGQSLKCFCSGTSKYISTPVYSFLPGHTYYLAYRIRVDRYVSGNCGVQTFKNTYHNEVTEGFVTVSNQYCYLVTGSGLTSKSYIGCISSADADAYIDDVVILDLTALFGAPPLKEVMDELYGEYIELLTAGSTAEKSSEYVLSAKPLREYSDAECKAAFMERMNQRAAELGMADSVFANASGLTTESLSSCRDLLKLGLAACASPRVMQALCTKSLTPTQKGGAVRSLSLSHLILTASSAPALTDYYPLLGGKGGSLSSPEIKNHLVFCDVGGKLAVLALMGAKDAESLFACEKELCDMLANGAAAGENLTALQDHGAYAAMLVPENPEAYLFNYSPAQLAERSGAVAFNGAAQFIPASVTKVLTAIVAAELIQPWELVTVAASDGEIGGSGLVFVEGDSFSFSDALAGMLLPSSNPMAEAIARTAGKRILDN